RPALHTALRYALWGSEEEISADLRKSILSSFQTMEDWVNHLQGGYHGVTGKPICHIIHLGIGGSDLGPRLLLEALKPFYQSTLDVRFASNVDPQELLEHLEQVDPERTLFILASKSFKTQETLESAQLAKAWLQKHLKIEQVYKHFLAITANISLAQQWGISKTHILPFWDWVGGRYSIWSCVGFPVALKIGMQHFKDFLAGGYKMDQHFKAAPIQHNMPIILALLGIWNNNFLKAPTHAILPYQYALRSLPAYLQQLDMESNGKSVQHYGRGVEYTTGPILWGQVGTNGQHAFYQLLHQGTHLVPADFILVAKPSSPGCQHMHDLLIANGLAQTQALMMGQESTVLHEWIPGNKPTNTLLLKELTPQSLGMLIALYEHKVYVQGVIWNINSFDQPGVELGKKLAHTVAKNFTNLEIKEVDPSTIQLLKKIKEYQTA
ncbi:MAG TPA: glucose-6-phosphate isomerase, partial [Gammaproteobacteria bacterium]|nr:glucose-6-phosphate isomerase [Gammaproteobacteria bacterium]